MHLIRTYKDKLMGFLEQHATLPTYNGPVDQEGRPHGVGRTVEVDYKSYEGDFVHGKRHGHGEVLYANGHRFVGAFEDDARCGLGREWWPNGQLKHEGAYLRSQRHGPGKMYSAEGALVFDGRICSWEAVGPQGATIVAEGG